MEQEMLDRRTKMNSNYYKQKKKYEILNQKNKEKTQAQKYNKLTEEMIKEFNSLKAKK